MSVVSEEQVYAPDQLKKGHPKAFRIAGVLVMIALVLMVLGNHHGHIEDIYLIATAALIAFALAADAVMRRNGLKRR
jgi:predicted tellurium resistance membrane protein TerC